MRWLALLILVSVAPAAVAAGMGYDEARHLLSRTGFAASRGSIEEFSRFTREQAVDRLISTSRTEAQTPPPVWVGDKFTPRSRLRNLSEEERKALQREEIQKSIELRAWWYREMLTTPSPLTEKMTLFWHNHFVSSQQKIKSSQLMYWQNVLLRKHALGDFGNLLHAISKDPAMIVFLDNISNRKTQPNENFAREVMELFTLGEGNYNEQDIKESARAFTGWSLDRESGQFRFYPQLHDTGVKTVLGKSGNFDGDAVLDILLAKPQTAELITHKLWREFISSQPESTEVKRLASVFRANGYNIKVLLRALLTTDAFYAKSNRGVLIKSPVEFIIGALSQFEIKPEEMRPFVLAGRSLGQDVFAPPNVKGWPGGENWINSNTLLIRKQLLERLFRAQEMPNADESAELMGRGRRMNMQRALSELRFDAERWFAQFKGTQQQKQAEITRLILATAPLNKPQSDSVIDLLRQLVLDPAYQLK